jgi:hypothetical protein
MTKIAKQLEQARTDRDAIDHEMMALDATKAEASKSSATFTKWRASVDEKTGERERLEICIAALEAEVEQQKLDCRPCRSRVSPLHSGKEDHRAGSADHRGWRQGRRNARSTCRGSQSQRR